MVRRGPRCRCEPRSGRCQKAFSCDFGATLVSRPTTAAAPPHQAPLIGLPPASGARPASLAAQGAGLGADQARSAVRPERATHTEQATPTLACYTPKRATPPGLACCISLSRDTPLAGANSVRAHATRASTARTNGAIRGCSTRRVSHAEGMWRVCLSACLSACLSDVLRACGLFFKGGRGNP